MVKYILHGGHAKADNEYNKSFFKEFASDFKGKTNVLLNFFAGEDDGIPEQINRYTRKISESSKSKDLNFIVANQNEFVNQLKNSDAMYVGGGNSPLLVKKMSRYGNLEKLFEGKVFAGSSAGAYFLTKYYYENTGSSFYRGLDILTIKALCHYGEDNRDIVEQLDNYKEKLPIIVLPDYKWTIMCK